MAPLLKTNLKEAVSSLSGSRQRSVLALIGIVIGIGSVIAMISVGAIAKDEAAKQFLALGTDMLAIQNTSKDRGTGRGAAATIALADALELTTLPGIEASAPYMTSSGHAHLAGRTSVQVYVVGVTQAFAELARLDVEEGRGISDLDRRRYYCVIGSKLAAAMRAASAGRVLGASPQDRRRHLYRRGSAAERGPGAAGDRDEPRRTDPHLHRAAGVGLLGHPPDRRAHEPERAPSSRRRTRCAPTFAASRRILPSGSTAHTG